MEKALLVLTLVGTFHLLFLAARRFGDGFDLGICSAGRRLPVSAVVHEKASWECMYPGSLLKDGEEDWSRFEIPTFIRRGLPMPKLEFVSPKKPARRKKAIKDLHEEKQPEAAPRFEVLL